MMDCTVLRKQLLSYMVVYCLVVNILQVSKCSASQCEEGASCRTCYVVNATNRKHNYIVCNNESTSCEVIIKNETEINIFHLHGKLDNLTTLSKMKRKCENDSLVAVFLPIPYPYHWQCELNATNVFRVHCNTDQAEKKGDSFTCATKICHVKWRRWRNGYTINIKPSTKTIILTYEKGKQASLQTEKQPSLILLNTTETWQCNMVFSYQILCTISSQNPSVGNFTISPINRERFSSDQNVFEDVCGKKTRCIRFFSHKEVLDINRSISNCTALVKDLNSDSLLDCVQQHIKIFDDYFYNMNCTGLYCASEIHTMLSVFENLTKPLVQFIGYNLHPRHDIFTGRVIGLSLITIGSEESMDGISDVRIERRRSLSETQLLLAKFKKFSNEIKTESGERMDSNVISISMFEEKQEVKKFAENEGIVIRFPNQEPNSSVVPSCRYMDTTVFQWLNTGLNITKNEQNWTECFSTHLTHFAVFVSDKKLSVKHAIAMKAITYVGCILSLIGVFIMVCLYIMFRKDLEVFSNDRYMVNLNLMVSIGVTQILFLFGKIAVNNHAVCKTVAILLHYSSLVTVSWMFVEGILLYIKVIQVFSGEHVRLRYFFVCAWGFPAFVVLVLASSYFEGYKSKHWCWISLQDGFSWSIFAPVLFVILFNTCILILVIKSILGVASTGEQKGMVWSSARTFTILFPVLGFSWVFSLFAVNLDSIIWQYLFVIFNSTQGFLIFLIYCIGNGELRSTLRNRWSRISENSMKTSPESKNNHAVTMETL